MATNPLPKGIDDLMTLAEDGAAVQVRVRARDSQSNEGPNSPVEEITLA